jgi:hypothetical protein
MPSHPVRPPDFASNCNTYRFQPPHPAAVLCIMKPRVRSLIGTGSRKRRSVLQATLRQSLISMSERRVRNSGLRALFKGSKTSA